LALSEYRLINTSTWKRYEHFRHFYDEAPCSVSICDDIDVTDLKNACSVKKKSFYVSFLYVTAHIINSHEEFRLTAIDSAASEYLMPAVWDRVDVVHNVFHEDTETYTNTFTLYKDDFSAFYKNCCEDIDRAKRLSVMSVPSPSNVFEASCVPWRHFTSIGIVAEPVVLTPIVAWGAFQPKDGRIMMPLSIQIHHAAADGFHISRFLNEAEDFSKTLADIIMGE